MVEMVAFVLTDKEELDPPPWATVVVLLLDDTLALKLESRFWAEDFLRMLGRPSGGCAIWCVSIWFNSRTAD